jgi:GDP-L-fucose synthase
MKVLLTGGSGFIGSNILEAGSLKNRYEFLSPSHAELDLIDTEQVDAFFRAHKVEAVVHAATKPGHRNAKDHEALFYSNTRIFHNLARHAGDLRRLIILGSGAAYGAEHYRPRMAEGYFGVHVPKDDHGFSRYVCGRHMEKSRNILDLRIFGMFGRREDYAIRFISNMMCKCLHGLPLTMKQDRRMDYLYVDDLMPVLDHFLANEAAHWDYNVTPDETSSLLDLAARVRALSGRDLPIVVASPGMAPEYSGDNARLKAECPAFAPRPMDAALEELYGWYRENLGRIDREALLHDK